VRDTAVTAYLVRDDSCGSPLYLRLLAVYVSLLANIGVLYQILSLISSIFEKNVRDKALIADLHLAIRSTNPRFHEDKALNPKL